MKLIAFFLSGFVAGMVLVYVVVVKELVYMVLWDSKTPTSRVGAKKGLDLIRRTVTDYVVDAIVTSHLTRANTTSGKSKKKAKKPWTPSYYEATSTTVKTAKPRRSTGGKPSKS